MSAAQKAGRHGFPALSTVQTPFVLAAAENSLTAALMQLAQIILLNGPQEAALPDL